MCVPFFEQHVDHGRGERFVSRGSAGGCVRLLFLEILVFDVFPFGLAVEVEGGEFWDAGGGHRDVDY